MQRDIPSLVLAPAFPDVVALDAKGDEYAKVHDVFAALTCWERALFLRQHYLGFESPDVWAQARVMCAYCTGEAGQALRCNQMEAARRLLRKADALATSADVALRIEMLNHQACYYRRVSPPRLRVAYDCLKKAMALDPKLPLPRNATMAETRLNACAVLSQLGRHDKALQLAQAALILLQEANDPTTLMAQAIAHHNIAVEEEFLQKTAQSLHSYRRAASLAAAHGGEDHPLASTLAASLAAAEAALAQKKQQKLFHQARDAKTRSAYCAPPAAKATASAVPKATKKAFGIAPRKASLADEMAPTKRVDMSEFEEVALADSFDAKAVASSLAASINANQEVAAVRSKVDAPGMEMMVTPRQPLSNEDETKGDDDQKERPDDEAEAKGGDEPQETLENKNGVDNDESQKEDKGDDGDKGDNGDVEEFDEAKPIEDDVGDADEGVDEVEPKNKEVLDDEDIGDNEDDKETEPSPEASADSARGGVDEATTNDDDDDA
ncbi:Aste57867_12774 [Aphanomyces stellatus]|uniref:Aste57867_12774 protein n=1 Tax=Aphanomyces stellatus TaxID=120398 RepID=A0A485KWV6_9STRA|nr:hypothetical protein As57867_012726 [Aphanomyces stellatus]VFT89623.1 Aste57867_12774 [Aphanomyces stellatus]